MLHTYFPAYADDPLQAEVTWFASPLTATLLAGNGLTPIVKANAGTTFLVRVPLRIPQGNNSVSVKQIVKQIPGTDGR
jgi:hypothetical protein